MMDDQHRPTASTTMALRRGLLAGVAVAATGVGVGLAWWARSGKDNVTPNATEENAAAALWGQQFETIDGRILPMASFQGRPLLINFWATWCPPCVEELPLLDQFYRDNAVKGWQVLGIAIDQKVKVEQFLKKMPLAFPVVLDGASGTQWSQALGNLTGSLPFSAAFSAKSQPIYRKIGKLSDTDLANLKLTT